MHRFLKALLLLVTCTLLSSAAYSQTLPIVQVSGRLSQGQLKVFTKDTLYRIVGQYTVSGTLLIEPGTTVEFTTNGRLIDSVGGRIIADGELQAIWNRNTGGVTAYPNRYCDVDYIRANVSIGARPEVTITGPSHMDIVPYILFYYANGRARCGSDPNLANTPYRRNVDRAPIIFRGRPVNQFSPEWGHIVVLPGADTAFFRNCQFVNFRKETRAVSLTDFYAPNAATGYSSTQITAGSALNTAMRNLTSGGGGAMTVFSSKTWLLNCRFDSNFARYHGGAVQFLQAPFDATGLFYPAAPGQPLAPTAYPATSPENYDLYGGTVATPFGPLRAFTVTSPAGGPSQYRQTYDDGRMAINSGRVRRMYFRDNRAVVSDTANDVSGFRDEITPEVIYPAGGLRKNEAFGGAVYISGRRLITVYLGRGTALDSLGILPGGDPTDTMVFERNHAVNYQAVNASSNGARGGALYVGDSTNMHFQLSRFIDNFTAAPNVAMTDYIGRGRMSQGGGIYMSQNAPVLTALGNVRFRNNKAGQGGGIYIAAVGDPTLDFYLSPVLGDSAYFISNKAEYDGGAIYTQRNTLFAAPYLITIDSTQATRPMIDRRILFDSNAAGMTGGAVVIDNRTNPSLSRARIENVLFRQNSVDSAKVADVRLIKLFNPMLSPISPANENGTHTVRDVYNMPAAIVPDVLGGGAIYSLNGNTNFFRSVEFFQNRARFGNGGAVSLILPGRRDNRYFLSAGDSAYDFNTGLPIEFLAGPEPTDQRQMTRFIMNTAEMDAVNTPVQRNPHGSTLGDPNRNGTGLGGALYINDLQPIAGIGTPRTDSVLLHRVRMEMDSAWSGSAVYSDNYDLRVVFNKSLVANNVANSTVGANVDTIQNYLLSPAASRVAGATFYGEIEGAMPSNEYHTNANSIYDNKARFIIRLPDAPANTGIGFGGIDSLRGNFWGRTEAPVTTALPSGTLQNTFYIQGDSCTLPLKNPAIPEQQGPFESTRKFGDPPGRYYTYTPVPIGVIPDTLLFEGRVYDIYDKGVDIKAVDYSAPRMAPIEDFSVGIPKRLTPFPSGVYAGKVVRRLTRDPFIVDIDPDYATLQREFVGNHPIGYPLFLDARANYIGNDDTTNNDRYSLNYTVFFVINVETGEFIRSNSRQLAEGNNEFRSRVEFVADSINRDPLQRRTYEGRAAFSIGEIARLAPQYYLETPGQLAGLVGPGATRLDSLEAARLAAAAYEDSVAVSGRRYGGRITPVLELGGNGFTYENRQNPPTFADIYAGERYRALPVLTGDRIWVISRTALWNTDQSITQVVNDARFTGLEFMIDNNNSIAAPIIFGQRDSLEARMPSELRNTRFLIEDTVYTASDLQPDTSRILEVTANDVNGFFDPRSIFFPDRYTALRFEYNTLQEFPGGLTIPNNNPAFVRLASWLKADTVFPNDPVNQRDSARGFLRFYGTPHNPDVVPGGELLEVRVSNYPPGVRTIDSLRGLIADTLVARYVFLYPPYFNCQVYDAQRSRYLQQDTVDVGGASTATYRLRIFVQDTPPTFLPDVSPCGNQGRTNVAVANLTNKLRFNFDVETDDELEDNSAEGEGWQFPYGRTTYGFVFTDRNVPSPNDSVATDDVREIRPVWMADSLLHNTSLVRDRGVSVLTKGNIIIRIDSAQAIEMLRNPAQANNAFNLDTMFTIVANDGHTGQNKRDMRAIVNVAPQLLPVPPAIATLPRAKEDFDYNPQLLDRTRGVQATDLNFNQRLRYYLVYRNDALNEARFQTNVPVLDSNGNPKINTATIAYVRRDGCYFEAGLFEAPKTTPDWLKVNTNSGLLYGTPGLNDAPRTNVTGGPETVTVVVEDEFGLTDVRTYLLEVDSTQHRPRLVGRPPVQCVDPSRPYSDSLCVSDLDLGRLRFNESLTVEVISPASGFTVSPSVINGPVGNGDSCITLRITAPSINDTGKVRVVIRVTDAAGNFDTLGYEISVSEPVLFSMPIRIRNTNIESGSNATQELVFGIARNATTGEDPSALGRLDSNYCEYELPPQPPRDVFDSRWTIPTRTGVLRNIFPENPSAGQGALTWKGLFQPGFLEGGSVNYPVVICWSISDAQRSPKNIHIMDPLAGSVFRIDMKSPTGFGVKLPSGGGVTLRVNGDTACVEILASSSLTGFHITYDLTSGVTEPVTGVSGYTLSANAPNPFSNTTEITFFSPKRGNARLEVFNMNGELVRTLVDGSIEAGRHSVIWNGTDEKGTAVASGTYTYRLTAGSNILTRTMVLVK